MKKWLSLLCSFLLLCTCLVPAFAANVEITPKYARQDNVLQVSLSLPKGSGLSTFLTVLKYDSEKLALDSVVFSAGDATVYKDDVVGAVKLSAIWEEEQQAEATLCTLTFQIKDGAEGNVAFEFNDTEATDKNDRPLSISFGKAKNRLYALTGTVQGNLNIPATAGTYIGIGVGVMGLCAITIGAVVFVRRKKESA